METMFNKNTYIGIDPGFKGAICICSKGNIIIEDLPIKDKQIDVISLSKIISPFIISSLQSDNAEIICYLEKAQSMPNQGSVSGFNYGLNYGKVIATLDALGLTINYIRPQEWKKFFNLVKKGKKDSVKKAEELSGEKDIFYGKRGGIKDGRAEAFLIARYAKEKKKDIKMKFELKNGAKIDVLGVTYTVLFVEGMEELDPFMDTFALCDIFKKEIRVWEGMPKSNWKRVFFHEVLHAIFFEARISYLSKDLANDEEDIVEIISVELSVCLETFGVVNAFSLEDSLKIIDFSKYSTPLRCLESYLYDKIAKVLLLDPEFKIK